MFMFYSLSDVEEYILLFPKSSLCFGSSSTTSYGYIVKVFMILI